MLISLVSVISLIAIIQSTLSSIFAKFTAKYSAAKDKEMLASVVSTGWKITIGISGIMLFAFLLLGSVIASFLHISSPLLIVLTAVGTAAVLLSSVYLGVFQGELRFKLVATLSIIGPIVKLIVGISLVLAGYSVGGALFGVLGTFIAPLLLSLVFLKVTVKNKDNTFEKKFLVEFKKYSLPFFLATFGITFMQSADVIIVRHLTSGVMSGQYAALSLMGKAIFYLTMPIYFVFFPLVAQKKEKAERLTGTLILASTVVFAVSIGITLFYFLFPNIILSIFYPKPAYSILTSYIGWYGVYISIFAVAYVLTSFFLSIGKTGVWKITLSIAGIFSMLLWFNHSNFSQIIFALTISSFLLLIALCIYYKTNGSN